MSAPRMPYKIRGPETWARVRESYLNGAPANVLAQRFDVTVAAIRMRAKREAWRKKDGEGPGGPEALPPALASVYPPPGRAFEPPIEDPAELAREAVAATDLCMRQNRLDEAASFARIALTLSRAAKGLVLWRPEVDTEGEEE